MKLIKTKDNSFTFFNEEFQEHYHSISGALEEANKKFIEPLELKDGMTILDICFGLGYNTLAAIEKYKNLKIIALENDPKILEELQRIELKGKFEIIKKLTKEKYYKDENYEITLILGDAKETIKQVKDKVDIVFLDPFSPKKNPELWTKEFFSDIYSIMKKESKLATYSCAGQVRRNLKEVGFKIKDGPCVGRRAPSTIAIKK
ncbi:tRNA (5-methylaminomethyl-2-thiouridine)(34)-methyltransferase MnmD [archaeon]|jgi:tRNA U34 5-methylaminomethyl-2-thiouridine-forming methyltransferase MnmC|nr:tRNA (5-methylaminomethyl-2-thiouridine)(34)-methyltransferase MnmD [archaeon]MBT3730725.1 tRNA (5-methylaminomethyl-2-thiouridine)(34)-methyltransferase MnmD [archaeon]MBT4669627.1 tRNA (5-methylaminomethyl-2-thiouridine)(34)-methyltransferase MnmD [archaeon]MBT5030384.1 tRNA (5-methylaminomethyl-2-thiouridine)(34)-methyltransferase MnmD [archaeon]MBT5288323.1 tRNA (5-methylaminomethyl-2-thiouridine)(34)-methyltransferase MnmD [archaeon]